MSDQVADLLDDAADLIEKYGLVKGMGGTRDDGFCVIGAVNTAAREKDLQATTVGLFAPPTQQALDAFANVMGIGSYIEIPRWNDARGRTQQEVLDALRLSAKKERMGSDV